MRDKWQVSHYCQGPSIPGAAEEMRYDVPGTSSAKETCLNSGHPVHVILIYMINKFGKVMTLIKVIMVVMIWVDT